MEKFGTDKTSAYPIVMGPPPLLTSGIGVLDAAQQSALFSARQVAKWNRRSVSHSDPEGTDSHPSVHGTDSGYTLVAQDAVVHNELTRFELGLFVVVCSGAVLRPPIRVYVNQSVAGAQPSVSIGAFTYIGPQVVCEAAEVGQFVRLEARCVIAAGARLPDGVWLLAGTWVPGEAVLASFAVYGGVPATLIRKLHPRSHPLLHLEFMRQLRAAAAGGEGL